MAWLLFTLIVTGNLGSRFGLPILFYSPEYLGKVSYLSYALLGLGFGALMMAFHTYSYSKLGRRFPFLVFVKYPFLRFCKNNSGIPLFFFIVYLINMSHYQWTEEYASIWTIIGYMLSFLVGIICFVILTLIYFLPISQKYSKLNLSANKDEDGEYPFRTVFMYQREGKWYSRIFAKTHQRYLYLGSGFQINLSRPISHIDDAVVQKVLNRNRVNTSLFEIASVFLFFIISMLPDYKIFELPAALSIVLLITIIFMIYSVVQTWMRKWTLVFAVIILLTLDYLSVNSTYFSYKNFAYGLNYDSNDRPHYSIANIEKNSLDAEANEQSLKNYIQILENWKAQTGEAKPKLIIVNTSGGGLRSAIWTLGVLQKLDQETNGKLKQSIQLYTGASGGMVGASYFREICLRYSLQEIKSIYSKEFYENLSKDMLNKLAFSASTRDLFLRISQFEYGGYSYPKDRGQAFEDQLHANTNSFLDHPLGYYEQFEKQAKIPVMIFTPTIVNDGRRLLISSQSLAFLAFQNNQSNNFIRSNENIDYQLFFRDMDPQKIRFSTVARSSATFPFVTPMVTLPTLPEVQLMDAGIRDNYGGKITMEMIFQLQDWIKKNTSGVVILQIRDTKKVLDNTKYFQVSLIDKVTLPFGNMYTNFPKTQDFDQEQLFKVGLKKLDFPVELINFNLREKVNDQISLSWHLSTQEKNKILQAFYSPTNQRALIQVKAALGIK
ncbi:MAG TPA: patatin-like phospholipase family protein [Taishania sp.]|nr:patatin-like phospholipase family protein [Taishania sp.]